MRSLSVLVAGLVVVFLGRAIYFDLRYRFLRRVETRWHAYLRAQSPTYDDVNVRWLEERTQKVRRIVEDAGTAPHEIRVMNPAGLRLSRSW